MKIGLSNIRTNCPICHNLEAEVSEGFFQANSSAVEVLSGPDSTYAIAAALKKIAEKAVAGDISQAEAIEQANHIAPKYGQVLERFLALGLPGLALLITMIGVYLQYVGNKSSSADMATLLSAVTEQTLVLKNDHYEPRVKQERTNPSRRQAGDKAVPAKSKSTRRADVNSQRRATLKAFREAYGRSRTR